MITDSIEANVENAEVHVERGAEQLQRAAQYQVQHELQLYTQTQLWHFICVSKMWRDGRILERIFKDNNNVFCLSL